MRAYVVIIFSLVFSSYSLADVNTFRVTLLGTGTPSSIERFSNSTLVEVGEQKLLFDFGRGNTNRIFQLGYLLNQIDVGFITHFHSDHTVGLPDYFLTSWTDHRGARNKKFPLYGPTGTTDFAKKLEIAYGNDENIRVKDEHLSSEAYGFDAHDVQPGVVYQNKGVTVIAFNNHHGDLIKPSYGYAILYQGKKVVISGDTTTYPEMVNNYKHANVIISEVNYFSQALLDQNKGYIAVKSHHISASDAGKVFTQVKPQLAVYTHIGIHDVKPISLFDQNKMITEQTRTTYQGPLLIGSDLMSIDLSGKDVAVYYNR